jgi:hypothetical protein
MRTSTIVLAALFAATSSAHRIHQHFAEGMRGDEDLGQDITMKGAPFHYAQRQFAEGDNDAKQGITINVKGQDISYAQGDHKPICNGTNTGRCQEPNGAPGLAQVEGVCDGSNGSNMQDCRVARWHDQMPRCNGNAGQITSGPNQNCVNTLAQVEGVCDGSNGSNMQDCRVSRWHDQMPRCTAGKAGEITSGPNQNCVNTLVQELPICNGSNGVRGKQCRAPSDSFAEGNGSTDAPICNGTNTGRCQEPDGTHGLYQAPRVVDPEHRPICNGFNTGRCQEPDGTKDQSLFQAAPASAERREMRPICNGTNSGRCEETDGTKGLTQAPGPVNPNHLPICNGSNTGRCQEPDGTKGLAQLQYYLPTCTDRQQEDCQPVCTESLTTGCTEARTPNWPSRDRFEGKYTHK